MNRDQESQPLPSHVTNGPQSPSVTQYGPAPTGYPLWYPPHLAQQQISNSPINPPTPPETQLSLGTAQTLPRFPAPQYPAFSFSQPQFAPQPSRYGPPGQVTNQGYPQPIPGPVSRNETTPKPTEMGVRPPVSFFNSPVEWQQHPGPPPSTQGQIPAPVLSPVVPLAPAVVDNSGVDSGANANEKLRIRVNKACERCRMHKIKCTGTYPCLNCQKLGKHCRFRSLIAPDDHVHKLVPVESSASVNSPLSEEVVARPAKENESPRDLEHHVLKRAKIEVEPVILNEKTAPNLTPDLDPNLTPGGPDPAYVTYLENRVRYLESVIANTPQNGQGSHKTNFPNPVEDLVDIQRPTSRRWRVCRRYQGALAIRLCASLYKGLSPKAQAEVQLPRTNYYGFNMSGCHYLKTEDLPLLPDVSILSQEHKDLLLNFFFDEINPIYAIVHEKVFREQYKAFHGSFKGKQPDNQMVLYSAMLSFVTALSIRFTELMKPEGPSKRMLLLEESLFRYAHKVVLIFSTEWESFELIQCWLLASLYFRIAHRQTSCYLGIGRAVSMTQSMSLGRYEKVPYTSTPYEIAKAKRIFYAVYTFDRAIGLQGGRSKAYSDTEIRRPFPLLDYEKECGEEGWMTIPAFAMLHIARLSNYLDTVYSTEHDSHTAEKMDHDFEELHHWLDKNGFHDDEIFPLDEKTQPISSMVKAQVKFHFYDLVQSIHGKMLFTFLGHQFSTEGLKISVILTTTQKMMALLQKVRTSGNLYSPWYLTLQTILTVGVNSLVFINGGIHVAESKRLMKEALNVLQILRNSPVCDKKGRVIFKQRFKMADECNWLLKMISHIMALHFEESLGDLRELGTDHGSSEVNKLTLEFDSPANNYLNEKRPLSNDSNGGDYNKTNDWPTNTVPTTVLESSQPNTVSPTEMPEYSVDQFLDNLAWFDQWLDFNHES